jgi:tetratricopeptide (TPR) repeat protein
MENKSKIITTTLLLLLIFTLPLSAEFPDSLDIDLIKYGLGLSYEEKYDEAEALFTQLQAKYPDHPCGDFFIAVTLYACMKDREYFEQADRFYDHIKKSIKLADKMRRKNRRDTWAYYFMGAANFYWAFLDAAKGGKFSVMQKGIRGKNLTKRCIDYNSTNYDALVGLGAFQYWGSVESEGFNWLPFIGDNRAEGLKNLELAAEKSLFSRDLTRSILVMVYSNEEQFERALALNDSLLAKYPECKMYMWAEAFTYFSAEDYDDALSSYSTLFDRIKNENEYQYNNYNLLSIAHKRMLCYFNLEQYDLAMKEIEYCDNLDLSKEVRKRVKDKLKSLKHHKKEILENR